MISQASADWPRGVILQTEGGIRVRSHRRGGSLHGLAILLLCLASARVAAAPQEASDDAVQSAKSVEGPATSATATEATTAEVDLAQWRSLLPKRGLAGWEVTDFYKHGEVTCTEGLLIFEPGNPLTGITSTQKDFPTSNFEIELQARRIEGNDFLCGLTFPVGKGFCSFIAGGWGGGLVGLSCVDGADASENATTSYLDFKNNQWYTFRVAVDDEFVRGWIDDREVFLQDREGHEFTTRIEVFANQPLGLCAYRSKVEIRGLRWRPLEDGGTSAGEQTTDGQRP